MKWIHAAIYGPNVSTTPITAIGCRQCLSLSVVQVKSKHCRKLHCRNGVVDTFQYTVRIYVATTIEKFFLDSDDGLCIKKNWQIQWDETFLIWTMAFWEKWCFLIMKVFCFPSYWSGLKSMKGSEIGALNPCDDSYFCQLLCQLSQLLIK